MVSIIVGIWDFAPSVVAEQGGPNDDGLGMDVTASDGTWTTNGTWWIESGDTVSHSDKTIVVNGHLVVNGSLTLNNVNLQMANATYDGQYNITVQSSGTLVIIDGDDDPLTSVDASVVESATAFRFGFQVYDGASFEMRNSELYDCGWSTSPFVDGQGLFINTPLAIVDGNHISNSYWGVIIWETDNVTIANNTIDGVEDIGIYSSESEYCYIMSNAVTNVPNYSIYLYLSIFFNVSYNSVTNSPNSYGISIVGGGGHSCYNNTIDDTDLGFFVSADASSFTTSYCYILANDISNSNRGIHVQGLNGVSAVQYIYIAENKIHSNSEYGIILYGDNGPFAINMVYIYENEIYNNVDSSGGHGVRFASGTFYGDVAFVYCYDNVIRDNSFSTSSGYYLEAVDDIYIWDENLSANRRNLWVDSSINVFLTNSTLIKSGLPGTVDIRIEDNYGRAPSVYFLNTTFLKTYTYVYDPGSFLDVKWFLHVKVEQGGTGVDNANVWINDTNGDPEPALGQPLDTGVGNDGWIKWIIVSDFNRTSSGTTSFTTHHIDATSGSAFGWADPTMDTSREVVIGLDTPPVVDDFTALKSSVLRTNQVNVLANATDTEDTEDLLIPHFEYRDPAEISWETAYLGAPSYVGVEPTGHWEISFTPPTTAALGLYDFRVRFEDTSSYFSDWSYLYDVVLVMNNFPYVELMSNITFTSAPPGYMFRGETAQIYGDGEDIEDGDDQNHAAAEFEYKRPGEPTWGTHSAYWNTVPEKISNDWKQDFLPTADVATPTGLYNFRVRFQDSDGDWSTWENLENITVENAWPVAVDLAAGASQMFRSESIWIFANGTDAEELELDLTVDFYYDAPGGGIVWEQTYLGSPVWDSSGFWRIQFTLPSDAPLGLYSFRVRLSDSYMDYNETFQYDSLEVVNDLPVLINIEPSSTEVVADVGSIYINVNASDYEDSEDVLIIEVEYRLNGTGPWFTAYIGPQSYFGSPPSGWLRVTFAPDAAATLGLYDFRVRVSDLDSTTSQNPEWIHNYNAVEVVSQIFSVDYIQIRTAPNEGGVVVTTATYGVSDVDTFYAAGYNFTGGYVADVDVSWSSDDPLVGDVSASGPSTTFTAQQVAVDSTCNVTATYIGVISNSTGVLTVLAPTIDYLEIRSAPSGGGVDLGNSMNYPTYPVGHTTTYYGALFNNSIGYLMDAPGSSTWDSNDPSFVLVTSPGASSLITCDIMNSGAVTITLIDSVNSLVDTTQVTVLAPTIDYVQINDGPDGGGTNLCDPLNYPVYPVGYSTTYYGGYYNLTAGFIGNVPGTSTWDSNDTAVVTVASPGISSILTCSNSNFGVVTITLVDGTGFSNTTEVTVMDVTIDYIQIRTQPGGSGIDLGDPGNYPSFSVGYATMFYAAAFNHSQGYIGDITVSWASSDSNVISVTTPGSSTNILCSDTVFDTVTIILNDGAGHTNSTEVTVLAPTVDYVQIRSASDGGGSIVSSSIEPVGGTGVLYGAQYNHTSGFLGNVPFSSTWASSSDSVVTTLSPSSYTIYTCNETNYGTITLTLDDGQGHTNTTEVMVLAPTRDYVVIMDAQGGSGTWVGDRTYGISQTDIFYIVAFNNTAGYVEDVVGQLWSSDHTDIGSVSPQADSDQVTFTAQVVNEDGICVVTVIFGGFTNSTGELTVLAPQPDSLVIMDAAGNSGSALDIRTFAVLEELPLYVAAFNQTTGYLYDVSATWESSDESIAVIDDITVPRFMAQSDATGGTVVITANYNGLSTTTGTLTVLPPGVDYISIRSEPLNAGGTVLTISMNESEIITIYLAGYNTSSGYVKDIPDATWSLDWALGSIVTSGTSATLTARGAGSGEISVTYQGSSTSATLTVNDLTPPGPPGTPVKNSAKGDEVTIGWTPSPDTDVKEYVIQRSTKPDGPWEDIGTVDLDTTIYTDSDVEPGKSYYYRVIAEDNASNPSLPSAFVKVSTPEESAGLFDNILFLLLLIIIIVVVVLIILLALLSKRKKGPEEVPEMEFEQMQPVVAQPRTSRPPPPRRQARAPPPKVVSKVVIETKPAEPKAPLAAKPSETPPPPPPPPEDAKPEESKDKKKKEEPPPPPPPPPE
jgi:parallel beta-helix repeat protein